MMKETDDMFENIDDVSTERTCCICYNETSNIRCEGCKRYATCIDCINNLRSRVHFSKLFDTPQCTRRLNEILEEYNFKDLVEDGDLMEEIESMIEGGTIGRIYKYRAEDYPTIWFKCPLCRHKNRIRLYEDKYSKEDVLRLTFRDYGRITEYQNKDSFYENVLSEFLNLFKDFRKDGPRKDITFLSIHTMYLIGAKRDMKWDLAKIKEENQELKKENEELKEQIEGLKKEVENMRMMIETMRAYKETIVMNVERYKDGIIDRFKEITRFTKKKREEFIGKVCSYDRIIEPIDI